MSKKKYCLIYMLVVVVLFTSYIILNSIFKEKTFPVSDVNKDDEYLNQDCILKTTIQYTCGHIEYTEEPLPLKYNGKNLNCFLELDPDITQKKIQKNILTIEKKVNTKCSQHYMIKLQENSLYIYSLKNPDSPIRKHPVDIIGLYEDELDILKKGIEFNDENALLEFLEDFDS